MVWMYFSGGDGEAPDLSVEARDVTSVRSLYIDCAPIITLRALSAFSVNLGRGGVNLLSMDACGQNLIAGVQPLGEEKTALHIVLPHDTRSRETGARRAAADWAETLRRELERDPAGITKATSGISP